jgi:hypothetical protein
MVEPSNIKFYISWAFFYLFATFLALDAGAWLNVEGSPGFYLVLGMITLTWIMLSYILVGLTLKEIKTNQR